MSSLKTIQFSLARALEDGGGSDLEAEMYVSEIVTCVEERIIKLLEEHQPSVLGRELGIYPCTCGYDSPEIDLTQHHIALIKGEK